MTLWDEFRETLATREFWLGTVAMLAVIVAGLVWLVSCG